MTKLTTEANPYLVAGSEVHFLGSISIHQSHTGLGGGFITERGTVMVLTDTLIELNPFLALVGDEEAQKAKFKGKVMVRPGGWPQGLLKTTPEDRTHFENREELRLRAHEIQDPKARALALADINRRYGAAPTSKEIASYRGGSGR